MGQKPIKAAKGDEIVGKGGKI
jgi:hypothetical protein